jgi:two-component system, CitB family, sensor kinase
MPVSRLPWARWPRRWSVATQTFVLQVLVGVIVVGIGTGAAFVQARSAATHEATVRALAVAETVAKSPQVVAAVAAGDPQHTLQPYAEGVRVETGTDFVVLMSPDGIRYSHPNPAQIGRHFIGHIAAAAAGGRVVEDYTGTLGPSRRVVLPVQDGGRVVGLVAVGIRKSAVSDQLKGQLPGLLLAGLAAAVLSGLGTGLVARRVRRQTHGLGESQLRSMVEYYDAVLHAVTEGLLLTDLDGRLRLVNDEAVRLLALPRDAIGRPVAELGLAEPIVAALTDDRPRDDELHLTAERVLVLNKARAHWEGRSLGFVATLRDRTDLENLTGELDTARGLTEALRSQAHESANRLHTIVSLIELGHPDRALSFATDELQLSQSLTDEVVGAVDEPVLAALLLGKAAQASERGVAFQVSGDLAWPAGTAPVRDVVTIIGNLVDNAFDAVGEVDGERRVTVDSVVQDGVVVLTVADTGPGLPPGAVDEVFRRGYSTKVGTAERRRGLGLALVAQAVQRAGGSLAVDGPPGAVFTVRLPIGGRRG